MKRIRKGLYTSKDERSLLENKNGLWEWYTYNADNEKVSGTSDTKKQAMQDMESAFWTKELTELYNNL